MTEKEKEILALLSDIKYYSEELESLKDDLKSVRVQITDCEEKLKEKRAALEKVM